MTNIHSKEWRSKPAGYYAKPSVKKRHDRKQRQLRIMERCDNCEPGTACDYHQEVLK